MYRRVKLGETDAAGIVYYPTFFVWFDDATLALLRRGDGPQRDGYGRPRDLFPIVESAATFVSPVQFDDTIAITSTVVHVGRSAVRIEHEVRRAEHLVASGFEVRVSVQIDGTTVTSVPLANDLREHLTTDVHTIAD